MQEGLGRSEAQRSDEKEGFEKVCDFVTENILYCGILSTSKATEDHSFREENRDSSKEDIDMAVIKLTKDNFDQEVMQSDKPVLVDFYADWCGPCKMMGPVVEEISNEETGVKVCKINIDEEIELAQRFGVMSIPTFIAVKGGEIAGKQIGAVPKSTLLGLVK